MAYSSSTERLVPITRVFLARYYDKYPSPPLPDDVVRLTRRLRELSDQLLRESPLTSGEELLAHEVECQTPHKIDENLWKNREHMEEILFLLDKSHWPRSLQQKATPEDTDIAAILEKLEIILQKTLKILESSQSKKADIVFNTVMTYMPQDFRGALIRQQRERSERNKQAEIDALVKSGRSIHDRYALLWKQQMERRRQLAQLGSAVGVYKTIVKYLVGVPQVLLDFLKQINDDQGPMEEQRHRYGPSLYSLTEMVLSIRFFLLISWGRFEAKKLQKDHLFIMEEAVLVYASNIEKFIKFIGCSRRITQGRRSSSSRISVSTNSEVFVNSPFLISAEESGTAESRKNDDYRETVIPPGKIHEVNLMVDAVNSYIAWDFSLIQGTLTQDIGFHVEYVSPSGEITLILPYRRFDSDQGNFCTILAGSYRLVWDNSYSTFFKKSLRYKVDAILPVVESSQPVAE